MTANAASSVRLKSLVKSFGAVDVIKNVDLTVEAGEFCVFVGPSGCGKSTLLRMISGLEQETSGSIEIGIEEPSCAHEISQRRRRIRLRSLLIDGVEERPHLRMSVRDGFARTEEGASRKRDLALAV